MGWQWLLACYEMSSLGLSPCGHVHVHMPLLSSWSLSSYLHELCAYIEVGRQALRRSVLQPYCRLEASRVGGQISRAADRCSGTMQLTSSPLL